MHSLSDHGPLLTATDFEPHVGKTFLVDAQPKPVEIRLEKIAHGRFDTGLTRNPFMLIFTSPWNVLLVAAVYRMQPNDGGPIEMFLVPTQTAPGPQRYYHAVFN
jgi:hypothetical protein